MSDQFFRQEALNYHASGGVESVDLTTTRSVLWSGYLITIVVVLGAAVLLGLDVPRCLRGAGMIHVAWGTSNHRVTVITLTAVVSDPEGYLRPGMTVGITTPTGSYASGSVVQILRWQDDPTAIRLLFSGLIPEQFNIRDSRSIHATVETGYGGDLTEGMVVFTEIEVGQQRFVSALVPRSRRTMVRLP